MSGDLWECSSVSHTTGDEMKTRAEKNPWGFEIRRLVIFERAWSGLGSEFKWDKRYRGRL